MTDRYEMGNWQARKDALTKAYYDLESNPLWKEVLEDCVLRAKDYESLAAGATTDRDSSRFAGMAVGLRTFLSRALEIREARMAHYDSEILKEEYEFGKETDAYGPGEELGDNANPGPHKIERRRFFADVQDDAPDA